MTRLSDDRARKIADTIDAYDQQITDGQEGKRETLQTARIELENLGLDKAAVKVEIDGLKKAIKTRQLRRSDPEKLDAAETVEALAAEYLDRIEGSSRAPRATRTREERRKDRMSESMADHKELSSELVAAGLISAEAHAENVAIADGMARKFGAGVQGPARIEPAPAYGSSTGPAEISESRKEAGTPASGEAHGRVCAPASPPHSPAGASTNPQSPSNRDVSAGDEASSEAGPQAEASLAGTGTETPAGREGRTQREEESVAFAPPPAYLPEEASGPEAAQEPSHEVAAMAHGAGEGDTRPVDLAPVQPQAPAPREPLIEGGHVWNNLRDAYLWPENEIQERWLRGDTLMKPEAAEAA